MGLWMELHCDMPRDGKAHPEFGQREHFGCYSDMNANPGVLLGGNTGVDARSGEHHLETAARAKGWELRRGIGWICPMCAKYGDRP